MSYFPKKKKPPIYRFSILLQISTSYFYLFSPSYRLSNNLLKASPVSVTIPWSIHLPRVTSRKTEQKGGEENGKRGESLELVSRCALGEARRGGIRSVSNIKNNSPPAGGAVAATRPGRVDEALPCNFRRRGRAGGF